MMLETHWSIWHCRDYKLCWRRWRGFQWCWTFSRRCQWRCMESIVIHGGGGGGDPPHAAPISFLVTYKLFKILMCCTVPPPRSRNPMEMYCVCWRGSQWRWTYSRHCHTWAPTFCQRGEECLKNCNTSQNGSRGGDTFSPFRGGVEGGKRGGQTKFLQEKTGIFCKSKSKKR